MTLLPRAAQAQVSAARFASRSILLGLFAHSPTHIVHLQTIRLALPAGLRCAAGRRNRMDERQIEITEAMLQRLLQAFRRGMKPQTLEEMVELLRQG